MHFRYWAAIFLLGFGWGSTFFFNEILLRELGPFTTSLGRLAFGALGCWIWVLARQENPKVSLKLVGILAIFGVFQYALPLTIFPYAQQFITSSAAGIVNAMMPILVVIISHMWPGGEKAVWYKSLGVVLGFVGIVVVVWPEFEGLGQSDPWAMLAAISAPVCYGVAVNMVRYMDSVKRTVMTAWSLSFGTLFLAPFALAIEGLPEIQQTETWVSLFIVGFVLTSAAFILVFWLIPRVGGTSSSVIGLITPVSAIWLGIVFLNEELLLLQAVGMAIIFVGLLCIDGRILGVGRKAQPDG